MTEIAPDGLPRSVRVTNELRAQVCKLYEQITMREADEIVSALGRFRSHLENLEAPIRSSPQRFHPHYQVYFDPIPDKRRYKTFRWQIFLLTLEEVPIDGG